MNKLTLSFIHIIFFIELFNITDLRNQIVYIDNIYI